MPPSLPCSLSAMEGFTIPTSETEWPEESYFADPKDIEDVDGVLEGTRRQRKSFGALAWNCFSQISLFLHCKTLTAPHWHTHFVVPCSVVASRIEKRPENLYDRRNFGILLSLVKYVRVFFIGDFLGFNLHVDRPY